MKKTRNRLLALIIALAFMITALPAFTLGFVKAADDDKTYPSEVSSLNLSNGQFETSYTAFPATADSWTGGFMDKSSNESSSNMKLGIVNLEPSVLSTANEKDALKLDGYTFAGGNTMPQALFGYNQELYQGTNTKALMINSGSANTAYAYTSTTLTLEPNKYYEFRAWVMTGNFSGDTGAFIRLVSTENKKLIMTSGPIDTSAQSFDKGWREYKFYVESSSYSSLSVNLSLQLGNYVAEDKDNDIKLSVNRSKGVAFFDNITAYTISKDSYDSIVENNKSDYIKTQSLKDYVDYDYTLGQYNEYNNPASAFSNNDFELSNNITEYNWSKIRSNAEIVNIYSLETNPYAPSGGTNVLRIDNVAASYSGAQTKPFTIKRHRNYRLSVWYKASGIESGSASVRVRENAEPDDRKISNKDINCLTSDGEDYFKGWNEAVVYIKGSAISDTELVLELLLGTDSSNATGVVYFDNFNLEYVDASEFDSVASDVYSLDTVTYDPANYTFNLAGAYKEYSYPLTPKNWTGYYAGNSSLTRPGNKGKSPENQDVLTGIVGIDKDHFEQNEPNYGAGVINPTSGLNSGNMLYIYSAKPTAYGYVSPAFTIEAEQYRTISVKMYAQLYSGGANLVLRSGTTILNTISNITENGTYTFVIEGGTSSKTVEVEIWMGLSDGEDQDTNLASGHLFVDSILINDTTRNPVDVNSYKSALNTRGTTRFSFKDETFDAYEETASYIKTPYTWTFNTSTKNNVNGNLAKGGIINSTAVTDGSELNSIGFLHDNLDSPNVMMINNPALGASYMKNTINYTLNAEKHYRITIRVMTINVYPADRNNAASYKNTGAMIKLTGANGEVFKAINTERDLKAGQTNNYKDYYFYVKTNESSADIGFELWLGNDEYTDLFVTGYAFFNNIIISEIIDSDFITSLELYEEEQELDESERTIDNIIKVVITGTAEEEPTENEPADKTPFPWWGVPSILFGIAIFAALIGVLIRKLAPKISKWHARRRKDTSLDHDKALQTIHARNMDKIRREKLEALNGEDEEYNDETGDKEETEDDVTGSDKKSSAEEKEELHDDLEEFDE